MAAFGEPLNIKDAYEVNELLEHRQGGAWTMDGAWATTVNHRDI